MTPHTYDESKMKFQQKVVIGNCTLYHGNCKDILPHLPAEYSICADPPYGVPILTDFDLTRAGGRVAQGATFKEVIGNDDEYDPSELMRFKEVITWGANHYAHRLPHNGRWLIWDKRCGVIPERSQADGEAAWHNEYGALRIIRHVWDGMIKDSEKGVPRVHPTQKPIVVMRECLKYLKGQVIIDPYAGSGTTGVACVKENRAFIGIELDPDYFKAMCQRIESAVNEPDLFLNTQKEEKPPTLFDMEKPKKPRKSKGKKAPAKT